MRKSFLTLSKEIKRNIFSIQTGGGTDSERELAEDWRGRWSDGRKVANRRAGSHAAAAESLRSRNWAPGRWLELTSRAPLDRLWDNHTSSQYTFCEKMLARTQCRDSNSWSRGDESSPMTTHLSIGAASVPLLLLRNIGHCLFSSH